MLVSYGCLGWATQCREFFVVLLVPETLLTINHYSINSLLVLVMLYLQSVCIDLVINNY